MSTLFEEQEVSDYFDAEAEVIEDESDKQSNVLNDLCTKCANTGFKVREVDGLISVVYTAHEADSLGRPVKKLSVCGHDIKLKF